MKPKCPKCESIEFKHMHNEAHGISGTHMSGSERFECKQCKHSVYASEGIPLGFNFVLDK